jgi:hypothetical protein
MRMPAAALLLLATCTPVCADVVDDNLASLVVNYQLEPYRDAAQTRCKRDVPGAGALLAEPAIGNFCLVRFGAPRTQALFVGVSLSANLDAKGRKAAAVAVDALLKPLVADAESRSRH